MGAYGRGPFESTALPQNGPGTSRQSERASFGETKRHTRKVVACIPTEADEIELRVVQT